MYCRVDLGEAECIDVYRIDGRTCPSLSCQIRSKGDRKARLVRRTRVGAVDGVDKETGIVHSG